MHDCFFPSSESIIPASEILASQTPTSIHSTTTSEAQASLNHKASASNKNSRTQHQHGYHHASCRHFLGNTATAPHTLHVSQPTPSPYYLSRSSFSVGNLAFFAPTNLSAASQATGRPRQASSVLHAQDPPGTIRGGGRAFYLSEKDSQMQVDSSIFNFGDSEGRVDPRLAASGVVSPSNTSTSRGSMASLSTSYRPGVSPESHHLSSVVTPNSQQDPNSQNAQDQKRTRACESCRSLKVKCEPDAANPEGSCRRCAKAHRECIFTVPTRKRQKRTDSRVAELERKIDKLTATLNAKRRGDNEPLPDFSESEASESETTGRPTQSRTESNNYGDTDNYRESEPKRQRLMSKDTGAGQRSSSIYEMEDVISNDAQSTFGSRMDHPTSASAPPKSQFAVPKHTKHHSILTPETDPSSMTSPAQGHNAELDVIDRKLLTMEMANRMFAHYNEHLAPHYPAVIFPDGTTAAEVRKYKPFLFLAILAAGSAIFDPDLNRVLNKEVIRSIADKVIVNGEKSLEIIQVLIIATLWYYPPDQFEELKFYQLTHIAAVMAIDVGIHRPNRPGARRAPWGPGGPTDCGSLGRTQSIVLRPLYDIPSAASGADPAKIGNPRELSGWKKTWMPDPSTLESRRTFLSCYWMCSNVAMSLRRPNLLRFSAYMGECVEFIENSPEASIYDKTICQWVKLQRITEEVGIAFGYEDAVSKVNLAETRIQFALKGFERQLEEWEKNLPKECESKTVRLASFTLSLFMHEVALHGEHSTDDFRPPFLQEKLLKAPDVDGKSPVNTLTQSHINALFSCLSSAHGLLDGFLALGPQQLRCLPVLFFARVAYAIVLLIKIYFSVTATKSDIGKVIEKPQLKLEYYFEKLLALLKATAAEDKSKPAAKFFMILTMLSHWYNYQQRAGSKPPGARRPSVVVPQSPGMRDQGKSREGNNFPGTPGSVYRQLDASSGGIHIATPLSNTGREASQPPDPANAENAPTPLQILSDVATTADDSSAQNSNAMNIDSVFGDFGSGMEGGANSALFGGPLDDNWLSNPLEMSVFGMGEMGFGVGLDSFNMANFGGFGDGSGNQAGGLFDGSGNNSGFFDGWPPN